MSMHQLTAGSEKLIYKMEPCPKKISGGRYAIKNSHMTNMLPWQLLYVPWQPKKLWQQRHNRLILI